MPQFSRKSLDELASVDPRLKGLFEAVGAVYDCTVLEGHRDRAAQDAAVRSGRSRTPWPRSKHNSEPARAVDAAPWPLDWEDLARFYHFAGYVQGVAQQQGIDIRWGGDWNMNFNFAENEFNDLVHFELV